MSHLNLDKRIHGSSSITIKSILEEMSKSQYKTEISMMWIDNDCERNCIPHIHNPRTGYCSCGHKIEIETTFLS